MEDEKSLAFITQLFGVAQAIERTSQSMLRRLGVTSRQRLAIRLLSEKDLSAGDLARGLRVDPSTMTGILTRLERDEFVERFMDPNDRRSWRFQLTAKGRGIVRLKSGTVESAVVDMISKLPAEDVEIAKRTLKQLEASLGEVCKHLETRKPALVDRINRRLRNGTTNGAELE